MSFIQPGKRSFATIGVPAEVLLGVALPRLERQAQYTRVLEKGGRGAAAMRSWLRQAADCIITLARPAAAFMSVESRAVPGGLRIADRVTLRGGDLSRDVARGGMVTAYLMTLDYTQKQAFELLEGDYGAHHVQSDLGGEVLFALGRHVHRLMRETNPSSRLRRVPVQAHGHCGQRRFWDPESVQALLSVFDDVNHGVTVTDTGCFQPLNSLLGLTIHTPAD
ncbi:MAG: hypothetical protein R3E44_01065 [Paracoccaceae bacterium]